MHSVVEIVAGSEKNYSKCPLKKRPVHFKFDDAIVTTTIDDVVRSGNFTSEEPENLCVKKEEDSASSISEEINVKDEDCCEDEGVDIDDVDDDEDELIDCEDLDDLDDGRALVEKSAAASAVAAAVAVAAASVVVPTPTYPKYGMQPWNFHVSPYTAEFYRTINNPHLAQQISPLRGDLLSPSSPSDSIGSLSPPPHYLHGRANSVSPPVRSEIIHRPIGVRQHQPSSHPLPPHSHRFLPYHHQPIQYYHPQTYGLTSLTSPPTLHHHQQQQQHQQHHQHHHHAPISPAYSDSSYFSMRSLTPESNCSSLPEDLSVKQMSKPLIEDPSSIHHRHSHLSHLHHHHHHRHSSHNHEKIDGNSTTIHSPIPASSVSIISSNSSSSSTTTTNTNINSSSPNSNIKKEKISPPRYQCPDCQKSYSTFSGLTKHQQFHCPAAEGNQIKKSFSCKDCDKTYVSLGALKMHIRTHTLPCKCNICGKAFSRPWLLQGHIRTHTGEKPFSCQHCHRAFADRSNLRAHLQTHSDIKKYSCTSCSKTFSRMSLLTKHSEGGCVAGGGSGGSGSGAGIVSSTSSNSSSDQIYLSPSSSSYPEH